MDKENLMTNTIEEASKKKKLKGNYILRDPASKEALAQFNGDVEGKHGKGMLNGTFYNSSAESPDGSSDASAVAGSGGEGGGMGESLTEAKVFSSKAKGYVDIPDFIQLIDPRVISSKISQLSPKQYFTVGYVTPIYFYKKLLTKFTLVKLTEMTGYTGIDYRDTNTSDVNDTRIINKAQGQIDNPQGNTEYGAGYNSSNSQVKSRISGMRKDYDAVNKIVKQYDQEIYETDPVTGRRVKNAAGDYIVKETVKDLKTILFYPKTGTTPRVNYYIDLKDGDGFFKVDRSVLVDTIYKRVFDVIQSDDAKGHIEDDYELSEMEQIFLQDVTEKVKATLENDAKTIEDKTLSTGSKPDVRALYTNQIYLFQVDKDRLGDSLVEGLSEATHAQFAKPEGDKKTSYNNALAYANRFGKPFIYGYTNRRYNGKFFAFPQPIKCVKDVADCEREFRNRYKDCDVMYVAYPRSARANHDVKQNAYDAVAENESLTEAKRYVRRYYIRPQDIFCSNKAEILKALIDIDDENCSIYTLINLGDDKDVNKLTTDDIIYYYDEGILYDKNHVKVMDYDLYIKHEEQRDSIKPDQVSDATFNDVYDDRMTDRTIVETLVEGWRNDISTLDNVDWEESEDWYGVDTEDDWDNPSNEYDAAHNFLYDCIENKGYKSYEDIDLSELVDYANDPANHVKHKKYFYEIVHDDFDDDYKEIMGEENTAEPYSQEEWDELQKQQKIGEDNFAAFCDYIKSINKGNCNGAFGNRITNIYSMWLPDLGELSNDKFVQIAKEPRGNDEYNYIFKLREEFKEDNELDQDFDDYNAYGEKLHEGKEVDGICCICGEEIDGYGNNAEPYKEGRCCDACSLHFLGTTESTTHKIKNLEALN